MFSSLKYAALAGVGIAGFTGVLGALALAVRTGTSKRKRRPSTDLDTSVVDRDEQPSEPTAAGRAVDSDSNQKQAKRLKESTGPPVDDEEVPALSESPLEADCPPFPLLQLVDQPIFLDVCKHLSAKDIARLRVTSSQLVRNVDGEEAAHWAAKTRDWKAIWDLYRVGDLPLEISSGSWTLERLHLAENPPRFDQVEFTFASHALQSSEPHGTIHCLENVSKLMALHPGIRIQVTGFTQPDCPHSIAIRISASRAAMVALYLACRLCGLAVTSRNLQVTRNILADFPQILILGRREGDSGRAVKWGHEGTFRAFDVDFWSDSEDGYSDSEDDDDPDNSSSSSSSSEEEENNADEGMQEEEDQESTDEEAEGEDAAPDGSSSLSSPRRGLVSITAPRDWDINKPLDAASVATKLPSVCSSSTKCHRVPGAALRERLMEHLGRIQQVAGHNTAPKNSNWTELPQFDLSMDRRVEFTLLGV